MFAYTKKTIYKQLFNCTENTATFHLQKKILFNMFNTVKPLIMRTICSRKPAHKSDCNHVLCNALVFFQTVRVYLHKRKFKFIPQNSIFYVNA